MKSPVPVYSPVPPVAATVTVVVPPKHEIAGALDVAAKTAGAAATTTDVDEVHPLASVTV